MSEGATLWYLMRAGWPSIDSKSIVVPTKHGRTNNESSRTGTSPLLPRCHQVIVRRQPNGLTFQWQGNPAPEVYTFHLKAPSLSGDNRDASKRKRTSSSGGEWGNKRRSITTGVQANWVNREEAKAQAHCNDTSTKIATTSYYWRYHSVDPEEEEEE